MHLSLEQRCQGWKPSAGHAALFYITQALSAVRTAACVTCLIHFVAGKYYLSSISLKARLPELLHLSRPWIRVYGVVTVIDRAVNVRLLSPAKP